MRNNIGGWLYGETMRLISGVIELHEGIAHWYRKELARINADREMKSVPLEERELYDGMQEHLFANPITEPTRRARRSLLAVCVALLLLNAGINSALVSVVLGGLDKVKAAEVMGDSLAVLAIAAVYFLALFIVYFLTDVASWRADSAAKFLAAATEPLRETEKHYRQIRDKLESVPRTEVLQNLEKLSGKDREFVEKVINRIPPANLIPTPIQQTMVHVVRRLNHNNQQFGTKAKRHVLRVWVFEAGVPVVVAALAISKGWWLVWPMVSRIVTS